MSNKQLIVILSAIAAVVLLYFLPVKSSSTVIKEEQSNVQSTLNEKMDEALKLMQVQPMAGVKILKQVLEEDPKNIRALELLSEMTLRTNQFEKAVGYLERLNEVKPSREVERQLGETYFALKDTAKARSIFVKLYETAPDSKEKESIQQLMKQIK